MQIYSYCSYDLSPVGFYMGLADVDDSDKIYLRDEGIEPIIRNAFEVGEIRSIRGNLLGTDKYVVLKKKLKYKNESKTNMIMNFAFVFDNVSDFYSFITGIKEMEINDFVNGLAECVCPDSSVNKFALYLDGKKLRDFLSKIMVRTDKEDTVDYLQVNVISKQIESKRIHDIFLKQCAGNYEIVKDKKDEHVYIIKKKNNHKLLVVWRVIRILINQIKKLILKLVQ